MRKTFLNQKENKIKPKNYIDKQDSEIQGIISMVKSKKALEEQSLPQNKNWKPHKGNMNLIKLNY